MLAIDPFYETFRRLIQKDRKLREAIADYEIQLSNGFIPSVRLFVMADCLGVVQHRLLKIARTLLRLGNFADIILSHQGLETAYSIPAMIGIRPEINAPAKREESQMQQQTADAIRFRSWLHKELETRSAFFISTEGIYLKCHIQRGVISKIDPNEMEGKSLDEVLGINPAFHILLSIKDAYEHNKNLTIDYAINFQDETRRYEGEIIPCPGTNSVILFCKRVTPQPELPRQ